MAEALKLDTDEYLPLRDVVFKTLRDAILRGKLKPGERLMELKLASELGVSRTPIREAIRMLEQEGLAITIPRKGAEVAKMTEKDMEDVLQIREALDALAVQIACDKMTEQQLSKLSFEVKSFKRSIEANDLQRIISCDVEFHDIIYQSTNNPKLISLINSLREQMYRYRVEYLKDPKNYPVLSKEHEDIARALNERDKEKVTKLMSEHIRNQAEAVKDIIRDQE